MTTKRVPGYSNFGGGGPFASMGSPHPPARAKKAKAKPKPKKRAAPKKMKLPTLAACEKALGEKAETWVARCYEISCRIVAAGLVEGEAVYGHWLGKVHPRSHFADRGRMPFIQHGWILLKDGSILDPTRWVFEAVSPYLYVGSPPDEWEIHPCKTCGLLEEEHRDSGPEDRCDNYEREPWPYDEGGNQWRDAMTRGRPRPVPEGPRKLCRIHGQTAAWVEAILDENDASQLTVNQLFYLANMSYQAIKQAVGPEGVKMIYDAISDIDDTAISFIPVDNANRARRECGFTRS